ncbi:MAG: FAD binding domain-containing protein [Elusimicrobia bacterium]|nr:FAD binding domain-containing protein [Elusimicrobiota bacterium]
MKYFVPLSLTQAEKLKKRLKGSFYLAGGTMLNWRGAPKAKALIDLKELNLKGIKASKNKIEIGASVTIQELALSKEVPRAITKAAGNFTSINVRNIATAGGSVAGGFFISSLLPALAACEAEVEYYLSGKKKTAALTEWLKSKKGIVCAVIIKKLKRKVKITEDKIAASDFPAIVTAMGFELRGNKISRAVIAVSGARGPLTISEKAAEYLNGLKPREASAGKLCAAAAKDIKTSGNVKVSARVKQRMIESQLSALLKALV